MYTYINVPIEMIEVTELRQQFVQHFQRIKSYTPRQLEIIQHLSIYNNSSKSSDKMREKIIHNIAWNSWEIYILNYSYHHVYIMIINQWKEKIKNKLCKLNELNYGSINAWLRLLYICTKLMQLQWLWFIDRKK